MKERGLPDSRIGRESQQRYLNVLSTWLHTALCGEVQTPYHYFPWLTFFLAKFSQEVEK